MSKEDGVYNGDEKYDAFLEKVKQLTRMEESIQDADKAVVLFTASVEIGSEDIGYSNMLIVLTQLMAIALNKELGTSYHLSSGEDNITLH